MKNMTQVYVCISLRLVIHRVTTSDNIHRKDDVYLNTCIYNLRTLFTLTYT